MLWCVCVWSQYKVTMASPSSTFTGMIRGKDWWHAWQSSSLTSSGSYRSVLRAHWLWAVYVHPWGGGLADNVVHTKVNIVCTAILPQSRLQVLRSSRIRRNPAVVSTYCVCRIPCHCTASGSFVLGQWGSSVAPYQGVLSCEGRTTACPLLSWVVLKRMFLLYAATLPLNIYNTQKYNFRFSVLLSMERKVYYC